MSDQLEEALAAVEGVSITAFTAQDVEAIATLPLAVLKAVVSEAQFVALTKFVNVNQTIMGLNDGVRHDA